MPLVDLPGSTTGPDAAVVRVLSYNIRSMRDDRAALARVIRACAPDVVCVQEAPRFFRWRKAAAWLARETGLVYTTGGAPAAGPMILTSLRAHVEHAEDTLLPRVPGLHRRGFATAVLRFGGGHRDTGLRGPGLRDTGLRDTGLRDTGRPASGRPASGDGDGNAVRLGVVSCHLSLAEAERYEQAGMLLDHLTALDVPYAIAAGDINDRPDGRAFRRIAGKLRDGWATEPWGSEATFSPKDPRRRIDGVFASEGIEIIGCGVPAGLPGVTDADLRAATDHLPVLAALRLPRVSPV
ncbi:endonuclease/exonuclease/phosphatase family protein [Streptomyces rapamycinicus]|uniref:Endonuclease/exonuclease/phosphatase n=2 Tax=Streptomyces rapamycinicus TaxID=1226757 RepID=A0A3L8RFC0_STRRN|nr:endonuclease/exonuclease/phosphatase family protein [Streptomyces rapamycinicus]MBB4786258.1 endonuclease/exonuclease/phosphatase family metal-dependent hydrolase [Streptomyces rapamycinicus]RLV78281.1 endonuclease/exonuclease/phosphatase [Streptomyces rapamycinicus NRRL 5491]UTO66362.1 endonuclease/exonuclease/phosphatase family protein [Streptomyces rapamycinicus]UTP34316.1 endonuclease/exonuclease/phosphatase family protein [Streptomyces rapamycinicus NRRL 5491]